MFSKITIGFILILSLLANIGAFLLVKSLYLTTNLARLDPLQLDVYQDTPPPASVDKMRVVFFGDSRALSWPAPNEQLAPDFEFINRGIGNQTSEQIRLRYDQHVAPLEADIIVLQLCVNDLKIIPLRPALRDTIVSQCKDNLRDIISKAREQDATVVLSTVFPLGNVPLERKLIWSDDVAATIKEVNKFIVAQEADGVVVFPGYQLLLGEGDMIDPEYSRDLLHLNAAGYTALNKPLIELLERL